MESLQTEGLETFRPLLSLIITGIILAYIMYKKSR